ncbi:SDR family oxidoreductase [Pelovirga terrestris]|uniref:NAD(P)-dependent oxidoreductase n=1 Tax=Pelovirga terrestris TaxID=2771352 RepID=A0A8J6UKJ8_9BACT|nr:NAD(P)-dependent oxidoreductase [Pelovirga terrestris]MBD1399527.1 NAD(P)-dependent oxidoreductase [Pelovirga terrestris]
MVRSLAGKTLFITGASRGIGLAVALKAAADGANIVVAAKTTEAHPELPGTIYTAAEQIVAAGGQALPLAVDIRDEHQLQAAVAKAVETFGGIDILINNASAIFLAGVQQTPVKRFDLMHQVNVRGSYLAASYCLPHLLKSHNPHILSFSPPLNLDPRWFKHHPGYTMSKYAMSLAVIGLAAEYGEQGVAVNALWPRTVIATAALAMLGGMVKPENCRTPEIMADAAWYLLTRDSSHASGRFFIDEEVLGEEGISDFSTYAVAADQPLCPDLFLD